MRIWLKPRIEPYEPKVKIPQTCTQSCCGGFSTFDICPSGPFTLADKYHQLSLVAHFANALSAPGGEKATCEPGPGYLELRLGWNAKFHVLAPVCSFEAFWSSRGDATEAHHVSKTTWRHCLPKSPTSHPCLRRQTIPRGTEYRHFRRGLHRATTRRFEQHHRDIYPYGLVALSHAHASSTLGQDVTKLTIELASPVPSTA
jgi:hypothetical protein